MQKFSFAAPVAAFFLIAATATTCPAQLSWRADEGGPIFTFGAAVSFVFDINQPDGQQTGENEKLYSGGKSEESFNIDLVQLGISGSRGRVSYGAKIDFGDWVERIDDSLDDDIGLQEMFLAIDADFGVVSAGRLPTPLGYEVLEPWANANISRSRAWYFQSVSHDGVALAGEVGGFTLMGAVVNGMRINTEGTNNPDDEYGVIASVGRPIGDEAKIRLTAIYSDENDAQRFFELNGYLAGRHERWRYGLEGTWLDGDGHGGGANPVIPLDTSVWDLTAYGGGTFGNWSGDLRLSYTDQEGTNGNFFNRNTEGIVSFTATGGYEIYDGVVLRAEYRVDSANDDIFDDDNSGSDLAGPFGQTDLVNVVQVQLMWTPATGRD